MISLLNKCVDEDFIQLVKNSHSIKEIEEKLGYNSYSGHVANQIKERIKYLNIDISHFSSKQKHNWDIENPFELNSGISQNNLRERYKKGNYTQYKCSICGQEPFWNNKELPLILDHINGNNKDNRLENLHWVCPNCNYQLDTTGSKNKAYHPIKEYVKYYCIDCGKEVSAKHITRCVDCANKYRHNEAISNKPINREELKQLIRTTPFVQIGKKFNISDNAIRKWCKLYNLPSKVSEIKKYTDEEWQKV
ncbi:MAG: hypothetical protein IKR04_07505 [Clostridia bacterium]|nr:hypothetical protein [Clostridia bacterium]